MCVVIGECVVRVLTHSIEADFSKPNIRKGLPNEMKAEQLFDEFVLIVSQEGNVCKLERTISHTEFHGNEDFPQVHYQG